jgi:hypothetical protein
MTQANKIPAGNAGWRLQVRFCGGRHPPRVPELWTLAVTVNLYGEA